MKEGPLLHFYREYGPFLKTHYPGFSLRKMHFDLEDLQCSITQYLNHLKTGAPTEYFTKTAHFFGHKFYVNKKIFLPRFETEGLVELALPFIKKGDIVFDMGTGSGNIACTVSLECPYPISLTACDICEESLKVAKKNYLFHASKIPRRTRFTFLKSDRFFHFDLKANVIISNPPYIKARTDRNSVHPQVLKYEPHKAFFLDDKLYTSWYREFFRRVSVLLVPGGHFFMEGHECHLEHLKAVLEEFSFEQAEITQDLSGRKRFLKAERA